MPLETVGNLLEEEVVYIIAEVIHDLVPVNAVGSESDGRGFKDVHGLDLILGTSLNSDFALAGAVDNDLAENDGASARMLAHNALDDVAFTDDFNDEGVEHDLAFRLGEHTVHKQAPLVRIDIGEGVVAAPLGQDMGQCVAGLEQRIVGLFGKAAHYLLMARVEKGVRRRIPEVRKIHLSAKLADALYKQSLCAASGRLKSRGNAGRAAAADYNIVRTIQAIHGSPPFSSVEGSGLGRDPPCFYERISLLALEILKALGNGAIGQSERLDAALAVQRPGQDNTGVTAAAADGDDFDVSGEAGDRQRVTVRPLPSGARA